MPKKIGVPWIAFDRIFNMKVWIDLFHAEIHNRRAFICDPFDTVMANDNTLVVAFKTPEGIKRAHMVFDFSTKVGGVFEIWEGASWTAETGTLEPIVNRFRETSPTAPDSSMLLENQGQAAFTASDAMILNPTALNVATATRLRCIHAWGSQAQGVLSRGRDRNEFPLAPDTTYAVRFTAVGANNAAQLFLDWYSHTDEYGLV